MTKDGRCNGPDTTSAPRAEATVKVETDRVRVTEWRFGPGAGTGWHRHAHDYVVVPMTTGTLRIVGPGGHETLVPLSAGDPYARTAGVEHDVINASPGEFVFLEVEILR